MTDFEELESPFTVTSPENMSAEDTVSLFVDMFTDFPKIPKPGHMLLNGPRGSGKSMMFRYLMPDCQRIHLKCTLDKLPFYAVYVPIKNSELKLTELQRLERKHASAIINEHFMTIHIAELTFDSLFRNIPEHCNNDAQLESTRMFLNETLLKLLSNSGWDTSSLQSEDFANVREVLGKMRQICEDICSDLKMYLKRLAFHPEVIPYDGPLCTYIDFLFPLLNGLKKLQYMPGGPVFLLVDDADYLSLTQTKVLNAWVSTRNALKVSIKISTQLRYKTYHTLTGPTIDTPHDYSEVNISTVYTGSHKGNYRERVRGIVKKRLSKSKIESEPEKFFPEDVEQEKAIREIADDLKRKWNKGEGRGYRPGDDAYRYARPNFIKSLAGTSKSSSTYSYAGFDQLVHISSGIVRFFLEAASQMYSETEAKQLRKPVTSIPPIVQNYVIRDQANSFLFSDLEKKMDDQSRESPDEERIRKLSNLINALGGIFRQCLLSDRSERRVFSIAFSDRPNNEIQEILKLGVQNGYFHESTIGKKDSRSGGRTRLFILSRRLTPVFNLDPTGFAGYLFVTSDMIAQAMNNPESLLRRLDRKGLESEIESKQLPLF